MYSSHLMLFSLGHSREQQGEYSLPFTASIKGHLSTFFSAHQYTELRGSNPYQLQTYCIKWKMGLKCAVMWQTLLICIWGICLFLHWMIKACHCWWCCICIWMDFKYSYVLFINHFEIKSNRKKKYCQAK